MPPPAPTIPPPPSSPPPAPPKAPSSPAPAAGTLTITNANEGQTLHAKVGWTVVVALTAGNGMQPWVVDPPPAAMLAPAGAGTTYRAVAPGSLSITATDRPVCQPGQVCPHFIQAFKATVIVDAA
ncbi:MAG TPA: hypothetical protein VF157_06585 [Chloroflexota bacterium]